MKALICFLLIMTSGAALATESIVIASSYNAGYSGQATMLNVLNTANSAQKKYNFVLEPHPGAQGLIAMNFAQAGANNRLALIAAGAVDNFVTGKAKETDFVPVHAVGDACWVVTTNWTADESQGIRSIRPPAGTKDLILGVVGIGSVSHLAGLEISNQVKLPAVTVIFKSGTEAFLNLASNNGVNITIDSVPTVVNMKAKVPTLNMVGITCGDRHPQAAHVPTLTEQGFGNIPPVFNIILAPTNMPEHKRKEVGAILDKATQDVGFETLFASSGFKAAVFQRMTAQQFYDLRVGQIKSLRKKYSKEIASAEK